LIVQSLEFRVMNTSVLLAADGHDHALAGMEAARVFIEDCERRFSRFLPDSELSQLNRAAGRWCSISPDLMALLVQSLKFYQETGGLFDPSILPDLKRVGYDKSMDDLRALGASPASASTQMPRPAFDEIGLDLVGGRVCLPPGVEMDLGGIAKGWIIDRAAQLLGTYTTTCAVSAGGDMLFVGRPMDGTDWIVELEDPLGPDRTVARLHLGPGAVATSSVSKRTWEQAGKTRHHLIDPRTGEPAENEWLSVTVFAPEIMVAEVYAKSLLIGGEHEASRLASRRPEIDFIVIDSHGELFGSPRSKEYLSDINYIYRE
jgi:thiamine biosynthesis lipoprotein